jgi:hypothetical protein
MRLAANHAEHRSHSDTELPRSAPDALAGRLGMADGLFFVLSNPRAAQPPPSGASTGQP